MTIESAIADLTAAVSALNAVTAANTAILEKLEAGREAALAQLEHNAAAKPATRTRKKETPAAAEPTPAPAATETVATVSDDDLRAAAVAYMKGAGEDATARAARGANIKAITDHFGTATLVGPTGIQEPEQKVQALFYLKRFDAGAEVNFSAEYDFSGDPSQGVTGGNDFDAIG